VLEASEGDAVATRLQGTNLDDRVRYPWHEWSDGSVWVLTRGEDFDIIPESLQKLAYRWARRHGMRVRTDLSEFNVVRLQFVREGK